MSSEKAKPKWLILGGLGFLGRNFVKYLVDNNLASFIRIADKKAPFMAFLSQDYKTTILENPGLVECVPVDVSDDDMIGAAFSAAPGACPGSNLAGANNGAGAGAAMDGGPIVWDYVVNVAAETALGKKPEFYKKTVDGATKSAVLAAAMGVKKYIFISTASIYKSNSKNAAKEAGATIAPWTQVAESLAEAEAGLQEVAAGSGGSLSLIILRPALVYGPGDFGSLMPRCVVAATYKRTNDKMELLWDGDMKLSTVHVFDVARAIYHCARKASAGAVFNLADAADTDVGKVTAILGSIFGIDTGFMGTIKSNLANLKLDLVADTANENHLGPWLALLKEHGIKNTPLSPYLHKSLLAHNHLSVDGSAITESTGFKYAVPGGPTVDMLKEAVTQHITQGIFPPIL